MADLIVNSVKPVQVAQDTPAQQPQAVAPKAAVTTGASQYDGVRSSRKIANPVPALQAPGIKGTSTPARMTDGLGPGWDNIL
jgi:hypothetical protein